MEAMTSWLRRSTRSMCRAGTASSSQGSVSAESRAAEYGQFVGGGPTSRDLEGSWHADLRRRNLPAQWSAEELTCTGPRRTSPVASIPARATAEFELSDACRPKPSTRSRGLRHVLFRASSVGCGCRSLGLCSLAQHCGFCVRCWRDTIRGSPLRASVSRLWCARS